MKKYVLVGTGGRGFHMFGKTIVEDYQDTAQLVALFDYNMKRSAYVSEQLKGIPTYTDFERMMKEHKPQVAIIATPDHTHKDFIIRCFAAGCDVICEKPLTTTAAMCKEIQQAEQEYNRKVTVTFNCRFMPFFAEIKSLLKQGIIGDIFSINLEWLLDCSHGADYFRRWHRKLENSGGLLVHKATHHFDIVNWLLEEEPITVSANGTLRVYGENGTYRGERCFTCEHTSVCPYMYEEGDTPWIKSMYFDAEEEDGYYRDRCVFAPEINIYDNMSLSVQYSGGALLTYSLVAYSPYEGWKMSINGSKGRLEASEFYSGLKANHPVNELSIYPLNGNRVRYEVLKGKGVHGGGDAKLMRMLLRGDVEDPLRQFADSKDGIISAMIGIAGNQSIAEKKEISIQDLLK